MIFVTGGTGLVGAHILYELVNKNDKIVALKRSDKNLNIVKRVFSYYSDDYEELFKKINWVEADITDMFSVSDLFLKHKFTEVYHCAAFVSFDKKDINTMFNINVEGTKNMVDSAIANGVEKFCHISSIATLDKPVSSEKSPVTEDDIKFDFTNTSNYSKSKCLAENEIHRAIAEGLNCVIVNPSVIIGAGNWESSSSKLITTVAKGLKFYTSGGTGFVDVRDVARAACMLMDKNIFNRKYILNSENISYKQLFQSIADNLKVNRPSIRANGFMLNIAWLLGSIISFVTGKPKTLTKENVRSAQSRSFYSGASLLNDVDFEYIKIEDAIKFHAELYYNYHRKSLNKN